MKNYCAYVKAEARGDTYIQQPVYVTRIENKFHQKIENWTIKEIEKKTLDAIATLPRAQREDYNALFLKEVKNKNKSKYVDFFYQIQDEQDIPIAEGNGDFDESFC